MKSHHVRLNKRISRIWFKFMAFTFATMLLTAVFFASPLFFFMKREVILFHVNRPILTIIIFLLSSVAISTAITLILAKKIFRPIVEISAATKEIAKGNFDISIKGNYKIKELRELSADFNKMVHDLNGMDTLRSDFMINVSHELKTPIAAIEGFVTLLQDDAISNDEKKEYSALMKESTEQLSLLINNILTLSKLESQEIISEKKQFRVDEQIRKIILTLEPIWSEKEFELNINMDTAYYFGNESLLSHVWQNLLGNAMKFTDRGGTISVDLSEISGNITVQIADNGIGINEEDRKHIFNKFYRTNTAKEYGGNGLGLALAKRILDLSGAKITVESEVGKGSTFTVNLTKIIE